MSQQNIALYAGKSLDGTEILKNLAATKQAGWTTIILGLFHIGYPPKWKEAEIFFNDPPSIINGGEYLGDRSWPDHIAQLKQDSQITQIYASFGGGGDVVDFTTIRTIYENNSHTFHGTSLQANFKVLRETFPAIDGIDMDCEDQYDEDSFVAFCEMAIEMGFNVTFCPFERTNFWVNVFTRIDNIYKDRVKWWNLQCYAGGQGNDPQTWENALATATGRNFPRFILAGDWNRFWNPDANEWQGRCPEGVKADISNVKQQPCFGGAFIWQMDLILNPGRDWSTAGCASKSQPGMKDYVEAIQ
jgi:hypothetical protein